MDSSATSREMVRKVLSGEKTSLFPFIPWVCIHAAKLEQVPLRSMLSDPSVLTRALENTQKLYGYDLVVNIFDTTVEAEACGCPIKWISDKELPIVEGHKSIEHLIEGDISNIIHKGRLPVVVETTKRLKITLGRSVAIAGVVTGPFTLANYLIGGNIVDALEREPETSEHLVEFAGKVCLEVCKAYCEFEVDAMVLAESVMPRLSEKYFSLADSILGPFFNVVRFYNGLSLLLANGCTRESLGLLTNLEADALIVDSSIEADLKQVESRCIVGRAIPCSLIEGPKDKLIKYLDNCLNGDSPAAFISTEWQVPYNTSPENLHQLVKSLREV